MQKQENHKNRKKMKTYKITMVYNEEIGLANKSIWEQIEDPTKFICNMMTPSKDGKPRIPKEIRIKKEPMKKTEPRKKGFQEQKLFNQ